ncbi:MAG: alpha/beta fold hydrolase [Acidobacteria bacterium]|nr:alpha/beta fold hydrolase [Acidobacteriota bacterium]
MSFSVDRIRHLYDFQPHYLDLEGQRYHYLDEGQGEPVVMVHGNPSWSFMYRELARSLRKTYRVIVPDHMGCGLSDKPDSSVYPYTLERRADDLEELLDQLGITSNITLVVHDWGGPIGMRFATRHPDRIARLVIFNSAAFLLPGMKKLHWSLHFCRSSRLAAFLILKFNAFARVATYMGCRSQPMPREIRRAYAGPYDSSKNRIANLAFVRDIPLSPTDPAYAPLQEVQEKLDQFQETPMLICWGERDFVFDRDFLEEWIKRFPQADVHRFPEAGHYVLEELPEVIIPLVKEFLEKPSQGQ